MNGPVIARSGINQSVFKRTWQRVFVHPKKRAVRYAILAANTLLLLAVVGFVVKSPASTVSIQQSALAASRTDIAANPLDQLSSADIAVNVARMARLDEAVAVVNTADSLDNQLAITTGDNTVLNKPQVVATSLKSNKDIERYVTVAGDTVPSLAAKFGVTSDTIRWSNGVTGDVLPASKEIYLLPGVNGIIYTTKAGDTADSLAAKYHSNRDQIIAYNDAEINGLQPGTRIIIPDGSQQATASTASTLSVSSFGGLAWGASAIYGYNGYDYGWCTWYVASKVSVPTNWGNANTWDDGARASGWKVSSVPVPGAIAQVGYPGLGHVALVESVSPDGTMIKYSDMNGLAGWGRVGFSDWVPISHFQNYIYR